jgi:hypothetical protein
LHTSNPGAIAQRQIKQVSAILKQLNQELATKITGATAVSFSPPAIPGFSPLGGFNMQLEDTTNGRLSFQEFAETRKIFCKKRTKVAFFRHRVPSRNLLPTHRNMKSISTGISLMR